MSSNVLQVPWTQIRGDAKSYFAYLTEDDLDQIAGDEQKIVSKLQERYGIAQEEAQTKADEWIKVQNGTGEGRSGQRSGQKGEHQRTAKG